MGIRTVGSFEALAASLHLWYGEDVAQEALLIALQKQTQEKIGYVVGIARRLRDSGYSDAHRSGWSHAGRDSCRELSGLDANVGPSWQAVPSIPERAAIIMEILRQLPEWLLRWCLEDGYVYARPCGHEGISWIRVSCPLSGRLIGPLKTRCGCTPSVKGDGKEQCKIPVLNL